jgi:hypothetical protein
MTGNTDMQLLVTDTLQKKYRCGSENQIVSGVTTICLMQRDTSPSYRVDQAVDCGLWNVVPYWRELEHAAVHVDPEHPKHAQWVTCLVCMQAME